MILEQRVAESTPGEIIIEIVHPQHGVLASVSAERGGDEVTREFALLFAHAFELLEALLWMLLRHGFDRVGRRCDCPCCDAARDVIAKAEGKATT